MDRKILLIEDDRDLASFVQTGFEDEGISVTHASTGKQAEKWIENGAWDLIVLDLMLPDTKGETLLSRIRMVNGSQPVLVLTARGRIEDKVALFDLGCDDYLTKPFAFKELLARANALFRRNRHMEAEDKAYEGLTLDLTHSVAMRNNREVKLTPTEINLLRVFLQSPEQIFTRNEMMGAVWGQHSPLSHDTNFLHVHLHNLKKKLGELGCKEWIKTVRNRGFTLNAEQ